MDLLGVDVGFSETQRSTGIACLRGDELTIYRATSFWDDRKSGLPETFLPDVIAVDGPLLPWTTANGKHVRSCEQFFARGLFCRRCKPGLSHFGTGFELREAARAAADQFGAHFYGKDYSLGNHIVEAFPNLFLGVLVSNEDYLAMPKLRRGQKFDWLYDCAAKRLRRLADYAILPGAIYDRLVAEEDHELRAALICLLTAALAASKKATLAGSNEGGWFWLPPVRLWEPWAIDAASANLSAIS